MARIPSSNSTGTSTSSGLGIRVLIVGAKQRHWLKRAKRLESKDNDDKII